MKPSALLLRFSLLALCLSLFCIGGARAADDAGSLSLAAITADQRTLDTRVAELAKSYQTLLAQMRTLGASKEDLALVDGALAELDALRQKDMQGILQNLQTAAAKPGDIAPLAAALTAQKLVAARIASLVARLQLRQQELALAERAKEIAARQAANHQRTAGLNDDTPADSSPRILASAEQQAIREEALSLADQVQRLVADPKSMPSPDIARLAQPANLDALRAAANAADDALKSGDIKTAYAQQALLLDRLQRLSELGHLTPPPAEAARQAAEAVKSLLADQKALAAAKTPDPAKQAALAARAEELHSQIDGVQAAAGSQVRQAADTMRPDAANTPPTPAQQQQAEQHLQNAADLLDKQAAQLAATQTTPPTTPAAQTAQAEQTADFLRQAQILQKSQQQLNALADGATPPGPASLDLQQTDIIRHTASLQQQVQQAALSAAAPLGQAAVRMSEALSTANPAPTAQLADASRQIALERLAQAVALLSDAAKQQQQAAALAQAQQTAQTAADKLAAAQQNLQQAQQQANQGNTQNAQQAQQQANQNLQQAQQALNQAGQQSSGQLDASTQQAMSQSWQATQQAQQQAQQGNTQAAQAAADKAAQALAQAQAQMAQQAAQQQAGQGQGQQQGQPGQQVAQGQGQGQNQQPGQPGQPGQGQQSPPPGATGGENNSDTDVENMLNGSGATATANGANAVGTLSPAEREALAAARHQPVAPAYTTQVETYLDNLSEATDSR